MAGSKIIARSHQGSGFGNRVGDVVSGYLREKEKKRKPKYLRRKSCKLGYGQYLVTS